MLGPGARKLLLLCEPVSASSSHYDRIVAAGGSQAFISIGPGDGRSSSFRAHFENSGARRQLVHMNVSSIRERLSQEDSGC